MAERAGANTLRGGKRAYTAKILNDNWVEDRYHPDFDGVRPECSTTAAKQMDEATGVKHRKFGAKLTKKEAFDSTIDYSNTIGYDKKSYPETWESVTRSVHKHPATAKPTEFSTSFKLATNEMADDSKTEEYRRRWTKDSQATGTKYTSEANRAVKGTVAEKFMVSVTRRFAGVPKSVEDFKLRIIEKNGVIGIRTMGRLLKIMDTSGDGMLSRAEFKLGLSDYGLGFSEEEFFALWNYFDKDKSGFIDYGEFMSGIKGRMNETRAAVVGRAYEKLDSSGDGTVTTADLLTVYDTSFHPDVKAGRKTHEQVIRDFMAQWEKSGSVDGTVTFDEFASYYDDISAGIDDDEYFVFMVQQAWRLGDEKK